MYIHFQCDGDIFRGGAGDPADIPGSFFNLRQHIAALPEIGALQRFGTSHIYDAKLFGAGGSVDMAKGDIIEARPGELPVIQRQMFWIPTVGQQDMKATVIRRPLCDPETGSAISRDR